VPLANEAVARTLRLSSAAGHPRLRLAAWRRRHQRVRPSLMARSKCRISMAGMSPLLSAAGSWMEAVPMPRARSHSASARLAARRHAASMSAPLRPSVRLASVSSETPRPSVRRFVWMAKIARRA